jgi:hypothetical protein
VTGSYRQANPAKYSEAPNWNATDSQWQAAQDLDQGDQLLTATDTIVLVERLDWSTRHTHDLDVQGIDTVYVATTHADSSNATSNTGEEPTLS